MIFIFISDAMAHRPHAFGLTGEVQRKVRKVTKLQPLLKKYCTVSDFKIVSPSYWQCYKGSFYEPRSFPPSL